MQVSAYIPCYNGAATLAAAIAGVRRQEHAVEELFVVDNGSLDNSAAIAEEAGVRVIRRTGGEGRGAARARAMAEARHPLVLCCDASILLPPDFVSKALPWFADPNVAAVTGRIAQEAARTAADRWRHRHLFRTEERMQAVHGAAFTTGGAVVRAAAVREAGGYSAEMEEGEDADLGKRLLDRGRDVVFDPDLIYYQLGSNNMAQALERYARWNNAGQAAMTWPAYFRQLAYALRVMARQDLAARDIPCALISLASPHYQFWRSRRRGPGGARKAGEEK